MYDAIIRCKTLEEYSFIASSSGNNYIPIIDLHGRYGEIFQYNDMEIPILPFRQGREPISDRKLNFVKSKASLKRPIPRTKIVFTSHGIYPLGAYLSRQFGYKIAVIKNLKSTVRLGSRGSIFWFVGLSSEFKDDFLMAILQQSRARSISGVPLENHPKISLLSGQDISALSILLAKTVLNQRQEKKASLKAIAIQPTDNYSKVIIHEFGDQRNEFTREHNVKNLKTFFATQTKIDIVSLSTHGFESCANAGGGNVLCGLNSNANMTLSQTNENRLACSFGHNCPRGPKPYQLNQLPAKVLMLGSCNGLRLADSILDLNFNLGLQFLEGTGEIYVSNLFSSSGTKITATLFTSLMKSGYEIGTAVNFLNQFLTKSRLDHPSVLSIGNPEFRLLSPNRKFSIRRTLTSRKTLSLAQNETHISEFQIDDKELDATLKADNAVVLISSSQSDKPIYWFSAKCSQKNRITKIYIFRYPQFLGELKIRVSNILLIDQRLSDLESSLNFWKRHLSYLQESQTSEELESIIELGKSISNFRAELYRTRLYTTFPYRILEDYTDLVNQGIEEAIKKYTNLTLSRIVGSYWLYNSYAPDFKLKDCKYGNCPHCTNPLIIKEIHSLLCAEERQVYVCPKCGIIQDTSMNKILKNFNISIPNEIDFRTETNIKIQFIAISSSAEGELLICPRVSALPEDQIIIDPAVFKVKSLKNRQRYTINFSLKSNIKTLPHRYFLKIVLVSKHSISFYSKPFFGKP